MDDVTVAELIEQLKTLPSDVEVQATSSFDVAEKMPVTGIGHQSPVPKCGIKEYVWIEAY